MSTANHLAAWLDLTKQAVSTLDPKTRIVKAFWEKGLRSDGRLFAESRPYTVQHGILSHTSVGSALVKTCSDLLRLPQAEQTVVMAAVTVQVGQPSPLAPNQGDIVVTVTPLGAAKHTIMSTSSSSSVVVQSFVQRILEENVDLEQLLLVEGQVAYRLSVAISILATAGSSSLFDVCLAAAVAALLDTRLPVRPLLQNGVVMLEASRSNDTTATTTKPLRMPIVPCALTAASARLFVADNNNKNDSDAMCDESHMSTMSPQHYWIVDPNADEQQVQSAVATIVVDAAAVSPRHDSGTTDESILAIHWCPQPLRDATMSLPAIATSELAQLLPMATSHARDLYTVLQRS